MKNIIVAWAKGFLGFVGYIFFLAVTAVAAVMEILAFPVLFLASRYFAKAGEAFWFCTIKLFEFSNKCYDWSELPD